MTRDANRKWLDSLKPGDEVAVLFTTGDLMRIERIHRRTKREISVPMMCFSARTGSRVDDGFGHRIAPVEQQHRSREYQRSAAMRLSLAIVPSTPIPTLQAIELLLEWKCRESVATHVIELIHNLTREDLSQ